MLFFLPDRLEELSVNTSSVSYIDMVYGLELMYLSIAADGVYLEETSHPINGDFFACLNDFPFEAEYEQLTKLCCHLTYHSVLIQLHAKSLRRLSMT